MRLKATSTTLLPIVSIGGTPAVSRGDAVPHFANQPVAAEIGRKVLGTSERCN